MSAGAGIQKIFRINNAGLRYPLHFYHAVKMDNALSRDNTVLQWIVRSQHIPHIHNSTPEKDDTCPDINARIKTSLFFHSLFLFYEEKTNYYRVVISLTNQVPRQNNNITVLKNLSVSSSGNNYG